MQIKTSCHLSAITLAVPAALEEWGCVPRWQTGFPQLWGNAFHSTSYNQTTSHRENRMKIFPYSKSFQNGSSDKGTCLASLGMWAPSPGTVWKQMKRKDLTEIFLTSLHGPGPLPHTSNPMPTPTTMKFLTKLIFHTACLRKQLEGSL